MSARRRSTTGRLATMALVAAVATGLAACGGGSSAGGGASEASGAKVLKLWHYEGETSAMGVAWDKAIEIFKTEHPGVEVQFERKAFEQIQQNASMILNSDAGPDILEYNKGNGTAGLLASQGLLTDITPEATKRGWDKKVTGALATTAVYSDKGVMGTGKWFGVPNYGEYVTVYYNADMFTKYGLTVPTTLDDLTKVMDAFTAKGVTPLAMSGAEYPGTQLYYELALSKADRSWVDAYQLYKGTVDFKGGPVQYGVDTFDQWVKKGYVSKESASLKAEDMGTAWIAGKYPMLVSGTWWYGRIAAEAKFDWDTFLFPGNTLAPGSSGNLWVVPTNSKAKDLAYDFIDITMRPEIQTLIGNSGGIPIAADPSTITDAKNKKIIENFNGLLKSDGLAFYPDWPVPGYYDVVVSAMQGLINQSKTPAQVQDALEGPYTAGVKEVTGG
ncbi:ABC transporter substrate-binding protein [Kineosporia sp. R_H_3]|uniref:ABC transporter substrate-binding protein n=1 Tax=Kineosporia sp. R_H_3 TaxID=1961848 RepID=UPI000B4B45C2|nr:extracellular solute-binding protein [Kineosporia sp. R_H_3]